MRSVEDMAHEYAVEILKTVHANHEHLSEIDELKAQLCKARERLGLIQEEFVETETYLKEQIEQKNSKITSFEYLVEQDKIHIQSQQSRIVDLKAQLECCRRENAVLLGKLKDALDELESALSCCESTETECVLIEIRKPLRGAND